MLTPVLLGSSNTPRGAEGRCVFTPVSWGMRDPEGGCVFTPESQIRAACLRQCGRLRAPSAGGSVLGKACLVLTERSSALPHQVRKGLRVYASVVRDSREGSRRGLRVYAGASRLGGGSLHGLLGSPGSSDPRRLGVNPCANRNAILAFDLIFANRLALRS